ncbi:hypothetical protein VTK73DRAFT_6105 [Phialemonium thermophilum]|uniref:Uncharacterized protein n=1 Tax=Phialemonium thermophilum TaxID=223376 RepID=A0ABR3WKS5_9PEZI
MHDWFISNFQHAILVTPRIECLEENGRMVPPKCLVQARCAFRTSGQHLHCRSLDAIHDTDRHLAWLDTLRTNPPEPAQRVSVSLVQSLQARVGDVHLELPLCENRIPHWVNEKAPALLLLLLLLLHLEEKMRSQAPDEGIWTKAWVT